MFLHSGTWAEHELPSLLHRYVSVFIFSNVGIAEIRWIRAIKVAANAAEILYCVSLRRTRRNSSPVAPVLGTLVSFLQEVKHFDTHGQRECLSNTNYHANNIEWTELSRRAKSSLSFLPTRETVGLLYNLESPFILSFVYSGPQTGCLIQITLRSIYDFCLPNGLFLPVFDLKYGIKFSFIQFASLVIQIIFCYVYKQ
jgi:hypothetical protein